MTVRSRDNAQRKTRELVAFKSSIRRRLSVREYSGELIAIEDVLDALDDARMAPSPFNSQPWRFLILSDRGSLRDLAQRAERQAHVESAQHAVVFCTMIRPEDAFNAIFASNYSSEPNAIESIAKCSSIYRKRRQLSTHNIESEVREATMLAAMTFMLSLAARDIASCPIGGFCHLAVSSRFKIDASLVATIIVTVGKAAVTNNARPARLALQDLLISHNC